MGIYSLVARQQKEFTMPCPSHLLPPSGKFAVIVEDPATDQWSCHDTYDAASSAFEAAGHLDDDDRKGSLEFHILDSSGTVLKP